MTYQLSYSSLSLMKECRRCFYLDKKFGFKRPWGIKSGMPNAVDLILKHSMDKYRGKLPPQLSGFEELDGYVLYEGRDLSEMRNWRTNPYQMKDGKGNIVIGAFDDLLHNVKKNTFAYLDYKTTGNEPGPKFGELYYQSQCDIYTNFFIKAGRKVADFGTLLFFWPAPGDDGSVIFKSKPVFLKPNPDAADKSFAEAIELLGREEAPVASAKCGYCKYADLVAGKRTSAYQP